MSQPIAFTTTRHRCPHCRKSWAQKASAAKHVPLCFNDPERRTCKTCAHDEPAYYDWGADIYHDRECGLGHDQGPSCIGCGVHPEVCRCEIGQRSRPANQLRVLCPSWKQRSVTE